MFWLGVLDVSSVEYINRFPATVARQRVPHRPSGGVGKGILLLR